jgi:AbrB family looped-hinge helix DNA binding protein
VARDSQPIRMAANGRLSIPAKQRKALGLEAGGMVVSAVENGELRIRPIRAVLAEVQEKVSGMLDAAGTKPGRRLSDELIADRRAEAQREEREYRELPKFPRAGDS